MSQQYSAPLGTSTPWQIWVIGAVLAAILAAVTWQTRFSDGAGNQETAAVAWQQSLRFEDRPSGAVAVIDAASGQEIARFQGEQGFLRGSLRAMSRERQSRGLGAEAPFLLTGYVDGRVSLRDTATGVRLNLESFGPANSAVYSQLRLAQPTPGVKP